MREAKLILPVLDNDGEPLANELEAVRVALIEAFGGFTEISGAGGWKSPSGAVLRERVAIFYAAAGYADHERLRQNIKLANIARAARRDCRQSTVYCVGFDGEARLYEADAVIS